MKKLIFTFLIALFCISGICYASPMAKIVRKLGGVADDVPVRQMDDLIKPASNVGSTAIRHGDDVAKNRKLLKALDETLSGVVDPATLKSIKAMDTPSQEVILQIARGSKSVRENIPDVMLRSQFIKEASGETLEALGKGDKLLVKDALNFKNVIDAKALKAPEGMRNLTFDDFGAFFRKTGEGGMNFWTNYVRPHWKLWLTGTALTAIVLAPEEYLDELGNMTENGIKKIIAFGGNELGSVIKGAAKGTAEAAKEIPKNVCEGIAEGFFSDIWGIITFILILIGTFIVLWIFTPFGRFMKWMCGKPTNKQQPESTKSESTPQESAQAESAQTESTQTKSAPQDSTQAESNS